MTRRLLLGAALNWALVLPLLLCVPQMTEGRPGGGHSYSGGSRSSGSRSSGSRSSSSSSSRSSSGSHSSSGISEVTLDGFWTFVGWTFVFFMIVIVAGALSARKKNQSWDSQSGPTASPPRPPNSVSFASIRNRDPDFSLVLFEDFAYNLFARAHLARHDPAQLQALSPYLSDSARAHLAARESVGTPVTAALVGAMRVIVASSNQTESKVNLEFEANLIGDPAKGGSTQYVQERWFLKRPAVQRTRPWKGVRTFGCPSCGSPLTTGASNICAACGQTIDDGRFDWMVHWIEIQEQSDRPPALTGTVEERGTDLPTVFGPGYRKALEALMRNDPALTHEAFEARLRLIYAELQEAWAGQELKRVRPYISAGLYQYLSYWVNAYRQQGLRNLVDDAEIESLRLVRVVRDAHYDALTFRIWGNGYDYTIDTRAGAVVGGSRSQKRPYTEYWTVIRGAAVRGAPRTEKTCPSCGAALQVNMEGNCEYCGTLVTAGDFDWVLSKIEQDDSYTG